MTANLNRPTASESLANRETSIRRPFQDAIDDGFHSVRNFHEAQCGGVHAVDRAFVGIFAEKSQVGQTKRCVANRPS